MTSPIKNLKLDKQQQALYDKLNTISSSLKPNFFKHLLTRQGKAGIYIYGSVGSGKSMLARDFFAKTKTTKLFIHYQDFMRSIHKTLHSYEVNHKIDAIQTLATEYAEKAKLLCLDELEIKDITDAMIIGRLFDELKKRKVYILITTNIAPQALYKDGLQRELFLPFIDMLMKDFEIVNLHGGPDYRMQQISSSKRLLYPLNQETKKKIHKIIAHLVDEEHYMTTKLMVFGREITFSKTYKSVLITNFSDLCQNNLSYNDYIEICNHFSTIVMEDVPIISSENTDVAIRFINFIDSVYFHRNLLFITMAGKPEELYINGKRSAEFTRTISRLHEMESDNYFNDAKK